MPFKSEEQRRYLWANEPEIARNWTDKYGNRIQRENGGIMRLPFVDGKGVDYADANLMLKVEELRNLYPDKYAQTSDEDLIKFIKAQELTKKTESSNWLKDMWSGITGSAPVQTAKEYTKMAFGPMMMLANRYNPLNPDAVNYNRHLQGQVDYLNQRGMLGDVGTGPYKIMSGPLRGKNLVSGFGTNDYYNMLQKKRDWFETRLDKKKSIGKRHYADLRAEIERVGDAKRAGEIDRSRGTFTGEHPDTPTKTPEQGGWHPGVGWKGKAQGGLIDFYKNGGFSG